MKVTVAFLLHSLALAQSLQQHRRPPAPPRAPALLAARSSSNDGVRAAAASVLLPLLLLLNPCLPPPAAAAAETLQDQLRAVQRAAAEQQKERVLADEQRLKMLEDEDVSEDKKTLVIARGMVTLAPTGLAFGYDGSLYPFGLETAAALDPALGNPQAALFVTAVGREGSPVAARRVPLSAVQFPYVFALTDADLMFPYTRLAWLQSPLSKDAVALTAVLDTDGVLATPDATDHFGFSISDPIRGGSPSAGALRRAEAKISVNLKSDGKPYTAEEADLLARIDVETARQKKP